MAVEEKRADRVVPKESDKDNREIKKVAMDVLQDEGKRSLAAILPVRKFSNRTRRGIEEERAVVGFAAVVALRSKTQRPAKHQPPPPTCPPLIFPTHTLPLQR